MRAAARTRHASSPSFRISATHDRIAATDAAHRSWPAWSRKLAEHAGIDHVVTVDAHTPAIEGFFRITVDNMTALPSLASSLAARLAGAVENGVIVAPDLGAVRLANRYATKLDLPVAVCHKRRLGGAEVSISRITGEVVGRRCIIVDDMISTGCTIVESVRALNEAGALPEHIVAATHAVLVSGALERIGHAGVRELLVTDSIAPRGEPTGFRATIASMAPLLATAIHRLLEGGSLRELV
jgi:ribose-phosphate pyrophosphokinase